MPDPVCELCGEAKESVDLCTDPYVEATSYNSEEYEKKVYLCDECYQAQKERS